jgi:hypothetical protein
MYSMVMARLGDGANDAPLAVAIADVPGVKLLLDDAWKAATAPALEVDQTTRERRPERFMVGRAVILLRMEFQDDVRMFESSQQERFRC